MLVLLGASRDFQEMRDGAPQFGPLLVVEQLRLVEILEAVGDFALDGEVADQARRRLDEQAARSERQLGDGAGDVSRLEETVALTSLVSSTRVL